MGLGERSVGSRAEISTEGWSGTDVNNSVNVAWV